MILLPRRLVADLSADQLRLIVAHELAHVRRYDNLVVLLQRVAKMLLFFHPVVWLCGWAMRREAEAACDDAVISAYRGSAEYADSLTRVVEMRDGLTRRLLVNTFAAAESQFSRRVRRILEGPVGRMTLALSAVSGIVLITLACLRLPSAAKRNRNPEEQRKVSEMTTKVKRESSKVWIEGVPPRERVTSVFGLDGLPPTLRAVLEFKGLDERYLDDVIFGAITGLGLPLLVQPRLGLVSGICARSASWCCGRGSARLRLQVASRRRWWSRLAGSCGWQEDAR